MITCSIKRIVCLAMALAASGAIAHAASPSRIDQAMYFQSDVRDASICDLKVSDDGTLSFPTGVTNPASSCPDAASWKVFFEAIRAEFWKNWAYDTEMWPEQPLAMCGTEGADPKACCDPSSLTNPGYDGTVPNRYCPFFPGDHPQYADKGISPTGTLRSGHGTIVDRIDPGRVMRQETAEIVFRNKPMFQYIFDKHLYSQEGLASAFSRAQHAASTVAPFRNVDATISFPIGSVVVKADWIDEQRMLDLGLIKTTDANGNRLDPPQNPDAPYITMNITNSIGDNDPVRFRPGLHYLVAITAATKDLPQWLWFAIEHVGSPGRCDYIGCNDSFGYSNPNAPKGTYANFIPPHVRPDNLDQGFTVFDTAKPYASGVVSSSLAAIYDRLGMNQKVDSNPDMPSPDDIAWRSYRLKGSQTQFVTGEGYPTLLGNVVTEGGFVNSSSCITCHTLASVNGEGAVAIPARGFAVQLNMLGYPRSTNGAPDLSMFFSPGGATYRALRTDYMWGTALAKPELTPAQIPASLK